MMEMDRVMTTNLWNCSSYNQPLYQRYDRQPRLHQHHHRPTYQMPDAMTPIFKSSQPYFNCAVQPPSIVADSVPEAWKMVRDVTDTERQWPAAVTGHVLGRATDAAAAMAAAAQRGWAPCPGIGT